MSGSSILSPYNLGVYGDSPYNLGPAPFLTNVSLEFNGTTDFLEHALRQAQGVANLWTITIWMKPFETVSFFDLEGLPTYKPDGKAVLHVKGATHRNEILVWGDRVENSTTEEFIMVENWDNRSNRIRVTRFNMAQKRNEWRNFSCAWDGSNLIAWDNGVELTDIDQTFSGTGSFIMEQPTESGKFRSVRIGAAYSGLPTRPDAPHVATYSGLLGPMAMWDEVLGVPELVEITSGTFGLDLSVNSGIAYSSSANLQHWWRLGAHETCVGFDYRPFNMVDVGIDATISGPNVVVDSP